MLTALMATVISCVVSLAPPEGGAVSGYIKDLGASRPAVWREAVLQLAHIGAPALASLEEAAGSADESLKPRLVEVVEVMIVHTVEPKEVRKFERLWALGAPELEKGLVVARKLAGIEGYTSGTGLLRRGARGVERKRDPDAPLELVRQLIEMGPAGVVGGAELMEQPSAATKLYGIRVLTGLGATSFRPRLERLCTSTTPVTINGGCYVEMTTLGEHVRREIGTVGAFQDDRRAFVELESYIRFSRLDALRQARVSELFRATEAIRGAQSWDQVWKRARSVFQQVVTLPAPASPPSGADAR